MTNGAAGFLGSSLMAFVARSMASLAFPPWNAAAASSSSFAANFMLSSCGADFRRWQGRNGDRRDREDEQTHGNPSVERVWMILPTRRSYNTPQLPIRAFEEINRGSGAK